MTNNLYTQAGTELSLNKLFQNHWTDVYSFAKSKTRNHHQAEDLTCETFIKAFLKFETYNPSQKFKNWIFTICKNTFLDNRKSPSRKVGELDNRGSHFYLAMYWAEALAAQNKDMELKKQFSKMVFEKEEEKIVVENKVISKT